MVCAPYCTNIRQWIFAGLITSTGRNGALFLNDAIIEQSDSTSDLIAPCHSNELHTSSSIIFIDESIPGTLFWDSDQLPHRILLDLVFEVEKVIKGQALENMVVVGPGKYCAWPETAEQAYGH